MAASTSAGLLRERAFGFGSKCGAAEVEPQLQHGGGRWSQAVSERSQHFAQAVALESDEEKQEAVTWHAIVARVVKVR